MTRKQTAGGTPAPPRHRTPALPKHGIALCVSLIAALFISLCVVAQEEITAENLRDEHVVGAISAIVNEIYARQDPHSHWEPQPYGREMPGHQAGGYTALVTLALLYAGETYQDERLSRAIEYLKETTLGGTYAVAVRANLWSMLPPKFEPALQADTRWLLESFSENASGWYYTPDPDTRRRDNSIKQYGALGLWEAAKRGLNVPPRCWQSLEESILQMQLEDGGWNYNGAGPATGSMTTAGLTILFITQDFLHAREAIRIGRPRTSPNQAAIDRGLKWMAENFTTETNPGRGTDYYYYLYGVERVGLASGYRFFGEHDWYRLGAAELIRRLCAHDQQTGGMTVYERTGGDGRAGEITAIDLAFSLMFLSRGRVPVAINKLSDPALAWNNRPRDVANLTSWIRANSESGVNWQIVSMTAEPESWLDAPLLYLASHQAPPWIPADQSAFDAALAEHESYRRKVESGEAPEGSADPPLPSGELRKLKRYLDLGGTLFAVAEAGSRAFAEAIECAGRLLYPQYEWRDLPDDHPVYRLYQSTNEDRKIPLRGLSNGVRELIILSPETDLSETWQAGSGKEGPEFYLGMNAYLYASEMNRAKPRLARHVLAREAQPRQGSIPATIVRAVHSGNWDAEPLALDVFAAWAWNDRGLDISIRDHPLAMVDQIDPPPSLVCVSGVRAIELNDNERRAIRGYVESGGTILFETVGGTGDFTLAVERQMRTLFNEPIRTLLRHPVVTGENVPGAAAVSRVEYRPFSYGVFGAREMTTRLRGMVFENNEARILFSREDLSHGLLDQPCWGVCGYTPRFARDLLANIVQAAVK